jgi:putative ABC transport system permease protein
MGNLMQDIRYGIRTLGKNPGFATVAVLTLALGIGANTAIFSVVENVLLRPLPYPEPQQLVEIFNTYPPQIPRGGLPPADYVDWRKQNKSFLEMAAYTEVPQGFNLTGDGEAQRVQTEYASAGLFSMLGVRMPAGRLFTEEEDRTGNAPIVILSHKLWETRYGANPRIVGNTIALDNRRFTVVGVLPAGFRFLRATDLWMPLGEYGDLTDHLHHEFTAVARIRPGVSLEQAREEVASLHRMEERLDPAGHKNFGVAVQPLAEPGAVKIRSTLLVLFGAVGLVLLIACANVVNLLLVRNAGRQREIALRTALGAGPWRLTRQLLTESMLLALAGGAAGLLMASIGLKLLTAFVPADLVTLQEAKLNGGVLGFALIVCVSSGVICGVVPALRTLRADLAGMLKQGSKGSSAQGQRRTHNILVIAEIAMAIVPLIGAGLLLRSFQQLLEVDPGFRPEHVLTMEIEQPGIPFEEEAKLSDEEETKRAETQAIKFEEIAAQIRALPGVKDAGGINDLPLGNVLRSASRFLIEGQPAMVAGTRPIAQTRLTSLHYFSAAGISVLEGRTFGDDYWKAQDIVINEAMAKRFWAGESPLGKRVNLCSFNPKPCWFSVIGVVRNVHQFGLDEQPTYDVYFSGGWKPYVVVRTTGDPVALTGAIAEVVHKMDPNLPISHVMTMDGLLSESVAPRRFSAVLTGLFAGLALVLAAVGIYGVMSSAVSQRTQEIGVRMALGAQMANVRGMILGQTLKLTLIGVAIGLAGAFGVARFLASMVFGVGTHDAGTFLGVAVLLMVVALAASWIPARRAMRVDPIVALRHE